MNMPATTLIETRVAQPAPMPCADDVDALSTLINLAGRQRMLSQRIVLFCVLSAQGDGAALTTAQEALDLFRGSHQRLLASRERLPQDAARALQDGFFGAPAFDARAREFLRLAEDTLVAVAGGQPAARRLVGSLVARATPMLSLLNDMTQLYETLARRHALAQRQQLAALIERLSRAAGAN